MIKEDDFFSITDDNDEDKEYVMELTLFSFDRLKREPRGLKNEKVRLDHELQNLCANNYQVFLNSANSAVEASTAIGSMSRHVSQTVDSIPKLNDACVEFNSNIGALEETRHKNQILFQNRWTVLDLLEMPQLMWRCVRQKLFSEAIRLRQYSLNLRRRHPDILILVKIVNAMNETSERLQEQLLAKLETPIELHECVDLVGHLKSMDTLDENSLREKFLERRLICLENEISELEDDENDVATYLEKYLDHTRSGLFGVMTHYRAIFVDKEDIGPGQTSLLHIWVYKRIKSIRNKLQEKLALVDSGSKLNDLAEQCLNCGRSLGRSGADFRGIIIPIFEQAVINLFMKNTSKAESELQVALSENDWHVTAAVLAKLTSTATPSDDGPPPIIMEHPPLAALCNGYLETLNDLTECAPYSVIRVCSQTFEESISKVASILTEEFLKCKGESQKSALQTLIQVLYEDLLPFLCNGFDRIFSQMHLLQLDKLQEYFSNVYVKEEIDMEFGDEEMNPDTQFSKEEEVEPSNQSVLGNSIDEITDISPKT